ncbi:MAG: MgtC/SapB family protein [Clostridium sp.]|uniref:MgtC/SapB family protein n=1 Tax=Clostridium sp. TaxID=1506 RepID=UPI003F356BA6
MSNYFSYMESINMPWDFVIRLIIAAILGGVVGYERESHSKQAGIKTHILVCIGAALIMIVSQYGFFAVLGENVRVDPSRIAAQVVSGIGFLGGGIILKDSGNIRGLSTAAGIWCVAGIGLAIGCGLYLISVCTTILILIVFEVLTRLSKNFYNKQLEISIRAKEGKYEIFQELIKGNNVIITNMKVKSEEDKFNVATYRLRIKTNKDAERVIKRVCESKELYLEYFEIL